MLSPLGRSHSDVTSPTGSGRSAICSSPDAIASMRPTSSLRRSRRDSEILCSSLLTHPFRWSLVDHRYCPEAPLPPRSAVFCARCLPIPSHVVLLGRAGPFLSSGRRSHLFRSQLQRSFLLTSKTFISKTKSSLCTISSRPR